MFSLFILYVTLAVIFAGDAAEEKVAKIITGVIDKVGEVTNDIQNTVGQVTNDLQSQVLSCPKYKTTQVPNDQLMKIWYNIQTTVSRACALTKICGVNQVKQVAEVTTPIYITIKVLNNDGSLSTRFDVLQQLGDGKYVQKPLPTSVGPNGINQTEAVLFFQVVKISNDTMLVSQCPPAGFPQIYNGFSIYTTTGNMTNDVTTFYEYGVQNGLNLSSFHNVTDPACINFYKNHTGLCQSV